MVGFFSWDLSFEAFFVDFHGGSSILGLYFSPHGDPVHVGVFIVFDLFSRGTTCAHEASPLGIDFISICRRRCKLDDFIFPLDLYLSFSHPPSWVSDARKRARIAMRRWVANNKCRLRTEGEIAATDSNYAAMVRERHFVSLLHAVGRCGEGGWICSCDTVQRCGRYLVLDELSFAQPHSARMHPAVVIRAAAWGNDAGCTTGPRQTYINNFPVLINRNIIRSIHMFDDR